MNVTYFFNSKGVQISLEYHITLFKMLLIYNLLQIKKRISTYLCFDITVNYMTFFRLETKTAKGGFIN